MNLQALITYPFQVQGSSLGLDKGSRRNPGGQLPVCLEPTTDSCPLLSTELNPINVILDFSVL